MCLLHNIFQEFCNYFNIQRYCCFIPLKILSEYLKNRKVSFSAVLKYFCMRLSWKELRNYLQTVCQIYNNQILHYYVWVLGHLVPRKIAPNPKTNPKPNLNPNRVVIFLGGNCSDTLHVLRPEKTYTLRNNISK